jgi:hypothetical protein
VNIDIEGNTANALALTNLTAALARVIRAAVPGSQV